MSSPTRFTASTVFAGPNVTGTGLDHLLELLIGVVEAVLVLLLLFLLVFQVFLVDDFIQAIGWFLRLEIRLLLQILLVLEELVDLLHVAVALLHPLRLFAAGFRPESEPLPSLRTLEAFVPHFLIKIIACGPLVELFEVMHATVLDTWSAHLFPFSFVTVGCVGHV